MRQVSATYGDSRRRILVANSEGVLAGDDQVKTRFSVSCVAVGDTGMQTGRESIGSTVGWELFETYDVEELARLAAARALGKLSARPAPSGVMPVVLKSGSGGVLFHEACGHGLEADHIVRDASAFRGLVGERVASPLVTLVDDGTMGPEWGAIAIDDEGHRAGRNVLIDEGILTDYMWDWLRARKEGRESSGNGRRQSYQHLPMVRMTNTYVVNGTSDPEEIIRQTPWGVYVVQLGGGQVNPATGDFVFGMTEAYLIEDGVLTEPLRDANLIGNGPEVLRNIDVVGNDFAMGAAGHVRQGRAGGSGRRRAADAAGDGPDRRRDGGMSEELVDLARRVAGWARAGEQVEAYVARGRSTEVKVFEGDVESLSSAESAGVGIRVIVDHRQGFAYAGSLDEQVVAETLEEARDNAEWGTPDDDLGLASSDGVAAADLDLWRNELVGFPGRGEGGVGPRARAAGPRRRSSDPPGGVGLLGGLGERVGGGDQHRHPGLVGSDQLLRVGLRHRGRGRRHPDRWWLLRWAGAVGHLPRRRRRRCGRTARPGCSAPASRSRAGSPSSSNRGSPPPCSPCWPARSTASRC